MKTNVFGKVCWRLETFVGVPHRIIIIFAARLQSPGYFYLGTQIQIFQWLGLILLLQEL